MTGPWLSIIGVGEDGPDGLTPAARAALNAAEVVMGPPRHLSLVPTGGERVQWPVPFADGLPLLMERRGRPVAVLASGDPFWFGAGSVLVRDLERSEWHAFPGASVFSLAANRLGWPLERTVCLGLHAAPLTRLRPHLAPGTRIIATLRDGAAVAELGAWLSGIGFGASQMTVLEALGGPRERITTARADALTADHAHPVAVAIEPAGPALPLSAGRPDETFDNDGQITKRPIRALTLSALAPRAGEHLWDIGSGSGSIAIEWLMAHPACTATAIERRPDRAARIRANADALGQDRLRVVEGAAPYALDGLAPPDAIFVGGGLTEALLGRLTRLGARLVVNAVTLESEALVLAAEARLGGELLRVQTARPTSIGGFRGWDNAFPLLQWSWSP
ncbi:precorrin-6Y C5,15-methyltransferase (decarboxylating) [Palleronia marisminoris]|uniref:Precorrin-6Y C(5,15)-methyltransferase [decarboxylating] n=1 Tax=Palleronia marisminoris TaxID=315423 RepID=A0A1Y5TM67_9RHOB|nr:precorrin-6y C5,15-methyltransferase (decarboxylating) subunit CbiE [Palleronia marisminoris]SFH44260.1 precorrin-6Y C5,15-methyltransferase (decarboxylating) [Palleronia marisminoris]SLN67307.1 Precorrin-6Y C(5,15)-methyltransferase [decarboxylating] [Palleronia marisminoris]